MNAKITEKIDSKIIQMVWEDDKEINEVLYLETRNYPKERRVYTVSACPEQILSPQSRLLAESDLFKFPKGFVSNMYGPINIKEELIRSKGIIDENIEYLNRLLEVVNYIEKMEDENNLDVINKWEKSGLLNGMEKEQKGELSNYLEKTAIYLIAEEDKLAKKVDMSNQLGFTVFIFPIIMRIYVLIDDNGKKYKNFFSLVNYKELIDDFSKKYEEFDRNMASLAVEDPYTDLQAKFTIEYCENYVKNLKNGII